MIIVAGSVLVQEGKRERATELAVATSKATKAEAGCVDYTFYSDLANPNRFFIFEVWETQAALDDHFKTDHMRVFNQHLPEVLAAKPKIMRYEVSSAAPL
jgi:quinol monooxygenase YgiN